MNNLVSIITPTFNNLDIFSHLFRSLLCFTSHPFEWHIVLNGEPYPELKNYGDKRITWHQTPTNLGWMGGVDFLKYTVNGDYVLLLNDDVQILDYDYEWLTRLMEPLLQNPNVVMSAPISNAITGYQNIIMSRGIPHKRHSSDFVAGTCLLVKKSVLDDCNWLDETLPGGDDIDLCMQLKSKGFDFAVCRDVFVLHRYATTGRRLYGNYWDSQDHFDDIQKALIQKHGLTNYVKYRQSTDIRSLG